MHKEKLEALFKTIDDMDADAFVAFMSDDGVFRYGSQDAVQGKENVSGYVAGFFDGIKGLSHELIETWEGEGTMAVQGSVTYTRQDDAKVDVPFVNVFRFKGDLISEYLIHADPAPLFA